MNDVMCANGACGCHVPEDELYCSEYCGTAASHEAADGEGGCSCPHVDCQIAADIEPVVYADIRESEGKG